MAKNNHNYGGYPFVPSDIITLVASFFTQIVDLLHYGRISKRYHQLLLEHIKDPNNKQSRLLLLFAKTEMDFSVQSWAGHLCQIEVTQYINNKIKHGDQRIFNIANEEAMKEVLKINEVVNDELDLYNRIHRFLITDESRQKAVMNIVLKHGKLESKTPMFINKLHGLASSYDENEVLWRHISWLHGSRTGNEIWYYKSGGIRHITPVVDHVRQGKYVHFFEDGKISRVIHYEKGKKEGVDEIWRLLNGESIIKERSHFKGNRLEARQEYYPSGQVWSSSTYTYDNVRTKHDQPYRETKIFYETGELFSITLFKDDIKYSLHEEYNNAGTLSLRAEYMNGLRQTQEDFTYDDDNNLVFATKSHFHQGDIVLVETTQ